jgi:tol-pal system beta propeller repeat protein TolB
MNALLSRRRFVVLASTCALAAQPKWASAEGAFIQDVAWSPDGTQLLFSKGDVRGPMHLFLMHNDGSGLRQITTGASINEFGTWSPDGATIAFRSNRDGSPELYEMQFDGSNLRRLTFGGAPNTFPSYSPNGSIIFNSKQTAVWQIFELVSGKVPVQITNNAFSNENPVYSPDGRLIAFQSNRQGRDAIYVINADGSNERVVSGEEPATVFPAWRSNRVLTFSSSPNADSPVDSVKTVNLDTGRVSTIPIKAGFFVRWDPRGVHAAIISGSYPRTNLFRCNADGTNLVQLA